MDAVASSIVVAPEGLDPLDSGTRKSDRPRKLTAKGMENLAGNVGTVIQTMLRESREETVKQITKMHEEAVKEITSAHERMIETMGCVEEGAAGAETDDCDSGEIDRETAARHPEHPRASRSRTKANAGPDRRAQTNTADLARPRPRSGRGG
jgi:hypothetical protein